MSYLPAFHLADGPFVRCRICAAVVYTEDTATHDAFHEQIDFLEAERKGMELHLSRLDERDEQLRQMYAYLLDRLPAHDLDGRVIVTKTGRVMTEGEIKALAEEAENGYD